jgi:hypothetical protein
MFSKKKELHSNQMGSCHLDETVLGSSVILSQVNLLYAVVTVYLSPCCNTPGDMNSLLHSSNLKSYRLLSFHIKSCTWHTDSSFLLDQGHWGCSLLSAENNL